MNKLIMIRLFISYLSLLSLCILVLSGCEKSPLEVEKNTTEVFQIADLVGLPLAGNYEYAPVQDTTAVISTLVAFKSQDEEVKVNLSFSLRSSTYEENNFYTMLDVGEVVYDEEKGELSIWNSDEQIFLMKDHVSYHCLQVDYDFTFFYNLLYSDWLQAIRGKRNTILYTKNDSVSEFLKRESGLVLYSDSVTLSRNDPTRHQVHWISLQVYKHQSGKGYSCSVHTLMNLTDMGAGFKTLDFSLPYVEIDEENDEIRGYLSALNPEEPYIRIKYYPDQPAVFLHWKPGKYFQDQYWNRYIDDPVLPSIPLLDEELMIRLVPQFDCEY